MRFPWKITVTRIARLEAEFLLMRLVEKFQEQLTQAYTLHVADRVGLQEMLAWAIEVNIISERERDVWAEAAAVRAIILLTDASVPFFETKQQIRQLDPIVNVMPMRIRALV